MSLRSISAIALLAALAAAPAAGQSPRVVGSAGDWSKAEASGVMAYHTRTGSSSIEIGCDFARTLDGSGSGIALELNGRLLPPDAEVRFATEEASVVLPSGSSGGIDLGGCPDCRAAFARLWSMLRSGRALSVTGTDGNSATFSLRGTAELMPAAPCGT